MKKITLKHAAIALMIIGAPIAKAEQLGCTALDYQEMKEMTADELKVALCGNRKQGIKYKWSSFDIRMRITYRSGLAENAANEALASKEDDLKTQCSGQEGRILRVLKQKDESASEDIEYFKKVCPASTFKND